MAVFPGDELEACLAVAAAPAISCGVVAERCGLLRNAPDGAASLADSAPDEADETSATRLSSSRSPLPALESPLQEGVPLATTPKLLAPCAAATEEAVDVAGFISWWSMVPS
mmetsp:Transcript_67142/g.216593  ORF Transcript_67142/g.216593 Transcript_67142/m.216593 type:complete len:112 (+) Transcript_67142:716-1051(+)